MPDIPNLRELQMTTSKGKCVTETQQLKGEAKDSLSGTNSTSQYTTSGDAAPGSKGGMPSYK